jgi:RNA polymerase sigma-70 factor (ECF subfamily)
MEAMTPTADPAWLEGATVREPSTAGTENRWRAVFADLAEGRVRALDELYDLAAGDVYRLALWRTGSPEDAEDVVQDVFVRVAEKGHALESVRDPRRWLLTVTHRRAIDVLRRRRRRTDTPIDDVPFLVAPATDPDREIEARSMSRLVARLPARQREVVLLRHFAELSFRDIGRITGAPTFTAASRYRLALGRLRRLLEEQ